MSRFRCCLLSHVSTQSPPFTNSSNHGKILNGWTQIDLQHRGFKYSIIERDLGHCLYTIKGELISNYMLISVCRPVKTLKNIIWRKGRRNSSLESFVFCGSEHFQNVSPLYLRTALSVTYCMDLIAIAYICFPAVNCKMITADHIIFFLSYLYFLSRNFSTFRADTYSLNISLRLCWSRNRWNDSPLVLKEQLGSTPCSMCITYNARCMLHQSSLRHVKTWKFWREIPTKWQLPWGADNVLNMAKYRVSLFYLQDHIIWPTAELIKSNETLFYSR